MEGAAIQALAVALAVAENPDNRLDLQSFISHLLAFTTEAVYHAKIAKFSTLLEYSQDRQAIIRELGNGVEAFNSVPTAIFAFLSHLRDFALTVVYAVSLGGDTDTIASMAGAVSGAYLGIEAIPQKWQQHLENRDYILSLADRLWQVASGQW
jgi:poly(ADP-ribose) glycohydrolase ARH3